MLHERDWLQHFTPPADRRVQAQGEAVAGDPVLARDLADSRACRNLSDRLESRLRVGLGKFDSARQRREAPSSRALSASMSSHLGNLNLVGCRILDRIHRDTEGSHFVRSRAALDSAEAMEVLQASLTSIRSGSPDTALVDSLMGRLPSMLR